MPIFFDFHVINKMKFTCVFIFLLLKVSIGSSGQTDQFLAVQNYKGYSQDLLLQVIEKHYPQSSDDPRTLSKILEFEDVQITLRDAAVEETAKKLEGQSKMNRSQEKPLDDPSYCGYYWLSWLPWLDCPGGSREISSLLFSDDICTARKQ